MKPRTPILALLVAGALGILVAGGLLLAERSDEGDTDQQSAGSTPTPATAAAPIRTPTFPPSPTVEPIATGTEAAPTQQPSMTATPSLPDSDLPPLASDRERVLAPIDGLEIVVLKSLPPQYVLRVQAGLPSGCAQEAGYAAGRNGPLIEVTVYNSMPVADLICTAIYGMYEVNVPLGSDFEAGRLYSVTVNDDSIDFTAQ